MTLGLISARGGSVRLPRKNIKLFCGHPLLSWSIAQAKASKAIDYICVTTDDQEIFSVAYDMGVDQVILRPVWDNDTTLGVPSLHAVNELEKQGIVPDNVIQLLPTSPLRFPEDIDNLSFEFFDKKVTENMHCFAPDRECFIYENQRDMTNRFGIGYKVKSVITDKFWKYSALSGGTVMGEYKWLKREWENTPPSDRVNDKAAAENNGWYAHEKEQYAFAIRPWQCFETDYEDWFTVCEAIMEKMILKGRGIQLYQDYKEGHI